MTRGCYCVFRAILVWQSSRSGNEDDMSLHHSTVKCFQHHNNALEKGRVFAIYGVGGTQLHPRRTREDNRGVLKSRVWCYCIFNATSILRPSKSPAPSYSCPAAAVHPSTSCPRPTQCICIIMVALNSGQQTQRCTLGPTCARPRLSLAPLSQRYPAWRPFDHAKRIAVAVASMTMHIAADLCLLQSFILSRVIMATSCPYYVVAQRMSCTIVASWTKCFYISQQAATS